MENLLQVFHVKCIIMPVVVFARLFEIVLRFLDWLTVDNSLTLLEVVFYLLSIVYLLIQFVLLFTKPYSSS